MSENTAAWFKDYLDTHGSPTPGTEWFPELHSNKRVSLPVSGVDCAIIAASFAILADGRHDVAAFAQADTWSNASNVAMDPGLRVAVELCDWCLFDIQAVLSAWFYASLSGTMNPELACPVEHWGSMTRVAVKVQSTFRDLTGLDMLELYQEWRNSAACGDDSSGG